MLGKPKSEKSTNNLHTPCWKHRSNTENNIFFWEAKKITYIYLFPKNTDHDNMYFSVKIILVLLLSPRSQPSFPFL